MLDAVLPLCALKDSIAYIEEKAFIYLKFIDLIDELGLEELAEGLDGGHMAVGEDGLAQELLELRLVVVGELDAQLIGVVDDRPQRVEVLCLQVRLQRVKQGVGHDLLFVQLLGFLWFDVAVLAEVVNDFFEFEFLGDVERRLLLVVGGKRVLAVFFDEELDEHEVAAHGGAVQGGVAQVVDAEVGFDGAAEEVHGGHCLAVAWQCSLLLNL